MVAYFVFWFVPSSRASTWSPLLFVFVELKQSSAPTPQHRGYYNILFSRVYSHYQSTINHHPSATPTPPYDTAPREWPTMLGNPARACALVYIGLSHNRASCRAISISVAQRPAATRLLTRRISCYYGSSRWIESTCYKRARWQRQRDAFSVQRSTFSCDESTIASEWKFVSTANDHDHSTSSPDQEHPPNTFIKNILVCGDGDLSYCASIAPELERLNIELYATVLEVEEHHNRGK